MATQSPTPTATHETIQNQGAESAQPANVNQQNATEEPVKQTSTPSVFVNSQPMREEQVQNAVKFLSHPKVKGSPVMYRRSFLEKKGLTKEEIDEAFRRVPDSPPTVQTAGINQDGQLKTLSNTQQQAQPQTLQPGAPAPSPTGVNTSSATLSPSRFHWSHALIAIGVLAASGAGTAVIIKKSILPRLKSWIRKIALEEDDEQLEKTERKPTLMEEAAQAAKSAAAAAADVAKVSQDMLISKDEERRHFKEVVGLLDKQVQEMKSMTNALRKLEGQEDLQVTQTTSKQLIVNGKVDSDLRSVRSISPPASVEPPSSLHPKSYMEIMATVQRGEKPSNIRDINDLPPNPNQKPSNPRLVPKSKPWEVGQVQNTSTQVLHPQVNGDDLNTNIQDTTQSNGDDSLPWWQRKNVRIREIDNEYEYNGAPNGAAVSSQQPAQRAWVPPQPPPIAMAEAAEAIRRPKPVAQKEPTPDNQSVANSSDMSDETYSVTRRTGSDGAIEGSSSSINSLHSSGEIQEDQEVKYEEK